MQEEFATKLRRFRLRSRLSQNALAKEIGVDPSYINRIERGEREPPKRSIILDIAEILSLQEHERDELLLSAHYAPELAEKVNLTDPYFRVMAEILDDENADPENLAERLVNVLKQKRSESG